VDGYVEVQMLNEFFLLAESHLIDLVCFFHHNDGNEFLNVGDAGHL